MKITTKTNILKQIKKDFTKYQIDSMQLYTIKENNIIKIISYYTKIDEFDTNTNILKLTSKKYSSTTTKQQNKIKNNFLKYNNIILENL